MKRLLILLLILTVSTTYAARLFDGATDRIDYGNVMDWGGQAQTISFWGYASNDNVWSYINADHVAGDADKGGITIGRDPALLEIDIYARFDNTDLQKISGGDAWPDTTWTHVLVTWDGTIESDNLHIYANGSEVAYDTSTDGIGNAVAAAGSNSLGGRIYDDNVNYEGALAAFGRWDRVLATGEIAILAAGYSPRFIPRSLKFAPDLIRNQRDPISGEAGTLDGTTVIAHPRIIQPSGL